MPARGNGDDVRAIRRTDARGWLWTGSRSVDQSPFERQPTGDKQRLSKDLDAIPLGALRLA
jgi:hypothetical protein